MENIIQTIKIAKNRDLSPKIKNRFKLTGTATIIGDTTR